MSSISVSNYSMAIIIIIIIIIIITIIVIPTAYLMNKLRINGAGGAALLHGESPHGDALSYS
jgi:heme/copper-type cytochrome/quinol oxidase subunit 2